MAQYDKDGVKYLYVQKQTAYHKNKSKSQMTKQDIVMRESNLADCKLKQQSQIPSRWSCHSLLKLVILPPVFFI